MKRAVVYVRVSTDAQETEGTSLDTQERACVEHARAGGLDVVRVISDTASGATLDRPGMADLRAMLRRGEVDVLIAYAVDRLARDQVKMAVLFDEVSEAGATLTIVTEPFDSSPTGTLIMSVRSFAAQVEREKIAERTARGKGERARNGKIAQGNGKGIYGYTYDPTTGTRLINHDQAIVVRRIFDGFVNHGSAHGIAKRLNDEGIPTLTGKQWHPLTITRMLRNPAYSGWSVYRGTKAVKVLDHATGKRVRRVEARDESEWITIPNATPAIVTREVFDRAQYILGDPAHRKRLEDARVYPLRARVRCGECGAAMVGHSVQRGPLPLLPVHQGIERARRDALHGQARPGVVAGGRGTCRDRNAPRLARARAFGGRPRRGAPTRPCGVRARRP